MIFGPRHQDAAELWSSSGRPTHAGIGLLADHLEYVLELVSEERGRFGPSLTPPSLDPLGLPLRALTDS